MIKCDSCKFYQVNDAGLYCSKTKEYFSNGYVARTCSMTCGEKIKKQNE